MIYELERVRMNMNHILSINTETVVPLSIMKWPCNLPIIDHNRSDKGH